VLLYEWKKLKECAGYPRLIQYAQSQVDHRTNKIILNADHSGPQVDFARGECAGILLFASMADIEIGRLENEVRVLAEREEKQNEQTDDDDLGFPVEGI